jgi:hypothetical protein
VSKAKGGHFQLACACAFEGAHQVGLLGGGALCHGTMRLCARLSLFVKYWSKQDQDTSH